MQRLNFILTIGLIILLISCSKEVKKESIIIEKKLGSQAIEAFNEGKKALEEGAAGFSTGLDYYPQTFSDTDELIELSKIAASKNKVYSVHLRSHEKHRAFANGGILEAIEVARKSEVPLLVEHYRTVEQNAGQIDQLLEPVDKAKNEGIDITMETYSYPVGCTIPLIFFALIFTLILFSVIYYIRSIVGMELNFLFLLEDSAYAKFVQPKDYIIHFLMETESFFLTTIVASSINILGYYLHGIFEMLYVIESFTEQKTFGFYSLFLPAKLLAFSVGTTDPTVVITDSLIRYGVFTTFYGPFYYDFGYWGTLLFSLIFGVVILTIFDQSVKGTLSIIVLYFFLMSCIFLLFTLNILTAGPGQYVIIAWFIFSFNCMIFSPLQKLSEPNQSED